MKKLMAACCFALLANGTLFAQEASAGESFTPGLEFSGRIRAKTGIAIDMNERYASGDGRLMFQYNFSEYTFAVGRLDLSLFQDTSSLVEVGKAYVQSDLLREFLPNSPVGIIYMLGKNNMLGAYYGPDFFGDFDDGIFDGYDANWLSNAIQISLDPEIYPFTFTIQGDLDYNYQKGGMLDSAAFAGQQTGFAGAQFEGKTTSFGDIVSLGWAVAADAKYFANLGFSDLLMQHYRASLGLGLLMLPESFSLRIAGAFEHWRHSFFDNRSLDANGVEFAVGLDMGVMQMLNINVGFTHLNENTEVVYGDPSSSGGKKGDKAANIIGAKVAYVGIDRMQIYAGGEFNLTPDSKATGTMDKVGYEVGVDFILFDTVKLATGWQHGFASSNADNPVKNGQWFINARYEF